jgi:hypothetical protein
VGELTLLQTWKVRILVATGFVLGIALPAIAAEGPAQVTSLSGVWELRYDSMSVPAAELTPQALGGAAIRKGDMESRRWCRVAGMPALMIEARFLNIRQGTREIAIVPHMQAMSRHLYTDGVPRMNPRDFDPVSNGFSEARWEGAELVVTTTGFSGFGIRSIPGGGYRTPDSVLVERFRLLERENRLSVISTWTDPAVFSRPHTYEVRYYRFDPEVFVSPQSCNVFEEGREAFFAPALR